MYMYMTLSIIDMDFLYQFNLRLIAPLFTVSFHEMFEKKKFFKIFKSWQVFDWLAKWIILLGFMDLRWPRVFRRFSVGLVEVSKTRGPFYLYGLAETGALISDYINYCIILYPQQNAPAMLCSIMVTAYFYEVIDTNVVVPVPAFQ